VNPEQSDWERAALPTLRWVRDKPWGYNWRFDRDEPAEFVRGLSGTELDAALRRLENAGLIVGRRSETIGYFQWWQLRPTADGLRVLGDWPPDPRSTLDQVLVRLLQTLGDEAETEEEAKWYRRAAGSVARFGSNVVADVVKGEVRRLGGEIG
jgi:hypothetical protein